MISFMQFWWHHEMSYFVDATLICNCYSALSFIISNLPYMNDIFIRQSIWRATTKLKYMYARRIDIWFKIQLYSTCWIAICLLLTKNRQCYFRWQFDSTWDVLQYTLRWMCRSFCTLPNSNRVTLNSIVKCKNVTIENLWIKY